MCVTCRGCNEDAETISDGVLAAQVLPVVRYQQGKVGGCKRFPVELSTRWQIICVHSARAGAGPAAITGGHYWCTAGNHGGWFLYCVWLSMLFIVDACPLTRFERGLQALHEADEAAVEWLKRRFWHTRRFKEEEVVHMYGYCGLLEVRLRMDWVMVPAECTHY